MAQSQLTRRWGAVSAGEVVTMILLTSLALFMALPLVYMVSTAFKPLEELFLWPPRFIVLRPVMDNFEALLISTSALAVPFSRYIFNSLFVAAVVVAGVIILASLAACPLAKHRDMPGRNFIFLVVIAGLMFAPEVTQIPRYIVIDSLGMINTYWALILPFLPSTYGLFLMKQFTEQVPDELLESAVWMAPASCEYSGKSSCPWSGRPGLRSPSSPSYSPGMSSLARSCLPAPRPCAPCRSPS